MAGAGRRNQRKQCRQHGCQHGSKILGNRHARYAGPCGEQFRKKTRIDRIIPLIDNTPHEHAEHKGKRHILYAYGIEIGEGQQAGHQRTDNHRRASADTVGEVADKGDDDHSHDIADNRHPQINAFIHADTISRLHRIGCPENGCDNRNHIHQCHAHNAQHIAAMVEQGVLHGRTRPGSGFHLFGKCRGLLNLAPDHNAGNQHEHAEQKRNAPAPAGKILRR